MRDFTRLLRNKLMSRSVLGTTSDAGKYLRMLKIFVDLSSKKKKTSASRLGYLPVQTLDPDTLVPDSPRSDLSRAVNKHLDLANLCIEKRLHFHWPLMKPLSWIVTV